MLHVNDKEVDLDGTTYDVESSHTHDVCYFLMSEGDILEEYPKVCNALFEKFKVNEMFHGQQASDICTSPDDEIENYVSVAKLAFVELVRKGGVRVGGHSMTSLKQYMVLHIDYEDDVTDRVCKAVDAFFESRSKPSSPAKKRKKKATHGEQRCVCAMFANVLTCNWQEKGSPPKNANSRDK